MKCDARDRSVSRWAWLGALGLAALLVPGCGFMDGVSPSERRAIVESIEESQEPGPENAPHFLLWEGATLRDNSGTTVRVVRVKWKTRSEPQVIDELYLFRSGDLDFSMPNRFGDGWKRSADGLNWEAEG
jgi:hypothetical protein